MKHVRAYEADDGSIHKTKEGAGKASLAHLGRVKNGDQRGDSLGGDAVGFIIKNRKEVSRILYDIDAPEAAECR